MSETDTSNARAVAFERWATDFYDAFGAHCAARVAASAAPT